MRIITRSGRWHIERSDRRGDRTIPGEGWGSCGPAVTTNPSCAGTSRSPGFGASAVDPHARGRASPDHSPYRYEMTFRITVPAAMILACLGCAARNELPPPAARLVSRDPCPAAPQDSSHTKRVRARHAPISLRIPSDAVTTRQRVPFLPAGDVWRNPELVVVSYAVGRDMGGASGFRGYTSNVRHCAENIGGREAAVWIGHQMALEERQVVEGRWDLGAGKILTVEATSPDTAQAGRLLGVIRSVSFDR